MEQIDRRPRFFVLFRVSEGTTLRCAGEYPTFEKAGHFAIYLREQMPGSIVIVVMAKSVLAAIGKAQTRGWTTTEIGRS